MHEVWAFEHSVECSVSVEFAWSFWTNVRNWVLDADIESVELHGPFEAGTCGMTHTKSSGQIEWRVADVRPGKAVIEFPVPGALARFTWTFNDAKGRTLITQRASLSGEQAHTFAEAMGPGLQAGMPAGMRKLSDVMEAAARTHKPPSITTT